MEFKEKYINNNTTIYYNDEKLGTIQEIEKSILNGINLANEFAENNRYQNSIEFVIYPDTKTLQIDLFNEEREEWEICYENNESKICIISPESKNKFHNYEDILKVIEKSTIDYILKENYNKKPNWLDIGTYLSKLNTSTTTHGKIKIIELLNNAEYNFSDSYFLTKYLVENFTKDTVLKLMEEPEKYEEILRLDAEQIEEEVNKKYMI